VSNPKRDPLTEPQLDDFYNGLDNEYLVIEIMSLLAPNTNCTIGIEVADFISEVRDIAEDQVNYLVSILKRYRLIMPIIETKP